MKTLLLTIGITLGGMLTSLAQAQRLPMTIDSTQSSVNVSIAGSPSNSTLSGTATLDLELSDPPSGEAQIVALNLTLDESLNASLLFVSASTSPGDVTFNLRTPGDPGTIAGTSFDQLANLITVDGDLEVSDPLGLAGGNQTIDLSTLEISPVDFESVSVTQSGNIITITGSIAFNETLDLGGTSVPVVVDGTFVASGDTGLVIDFLGDVNMDLVVNFLDIAPFIAVLSAGEFNPQADLDQNGVVNFFDIAPFIAILTN